MLLIFLTSCAISMIVITLKYGFTTAMECPHCGASWKVRRKTIRRKSFNKIAPLESNASGLTTAFLKKNSIAQFHCIYCGEKWLADSSD